MCRPLFFLSTVFLLASGGVDGRRFLRANETRVKDQPNGEAACAYCASTGCADDCYTGGCLFTGVLKTEKQDMCSAWTWSCGVPFPGLAKPTRGYYHCPTFLEEVENCKICQRQGCGDCYAGKCDDYCHVISFNCGPQKGMNKCSVLMR